MIMPSWTSYASTSWGLWTLETTTSTVLASVEAEGALGQGGVLVPVGAQAREGPRAREGHQFERLQSRLRGDDPSRSYHSHCMILILLGCFFSFRLSPPWWWQFWMCLGTT
jgi:hypothetical protein